MTIWQPIESAPRDRTIILGLMRSDLPRREGGWSPDRWNGCYVPIRHSGITRSDYDLGWSVALPVGCGGLPDEWFVGWIPLPPPLGEPDAFAEWMAPFVGGAGRKDG